MKNKNNPFYITNNIPEIKFYKKVTIQCEIEEQYLVKLMQYLIEYGVRDLNLTTHEGPVITKDDINNESG